MALGGWTGNTYLLNVSLLGSSKESISAPLFCTGCCNCRKHWMRSNKQAAMDKWIGGSGGVSLDGCWSCDRQMKKLSPLSQTCFPIFFMSILLFFHVSLCVCFPATGVCKSFALSCGEGICRPADEQQLLVQEQEPWEGSGQDPSAVEQTQGTVWEHGNVTVTPQHKQHVQYRFNPQHCL